jgi:uncharacterized protein YndB with AHSA1/START domain
MEAELGTLERAGERWRLTYVRDLQHPPTTVWRAITEPEHLRAWFPSDIEGDRAAGAKLRFPFREEEGPTLEGEMLVFDEPRLLELRWGDDLLRFELEAVGGGCRLTFVNTFDEQGRAARDAAGWHVCLDALAAALDRGPAVGSPTSDAPAAKTPWRPLNERYTERFGPEAATIGPAPGVEVD